MVKALFCGDVKGRWSQLLDRLNELQKSKHGPFDVLFITGKLVDSAGEDADNSAIELPLKAYSFVDASAQHGKQLPSNLELIQGVCGMLNVQHNLTVGYCTRCTKDVMQSEAISKVQQITSGAGYRGCDILVTSDWPREMHHFLEPEEVQELKSSSIGIGSGTKEAADFSMLVRPRYHFVAGQGAFFQRSPYRHSSSGAAGFARLLTVDEVSASKDKAHKWMHALSISPIIRMSSAELADCPAGTTDCPYVDVGTALDSGSRNPFSDGEQLSKRMRTEAPPLPPGPPPRAGVGAGGAVGSFFFGSMGVPRAGGGGAGATPNLVPPSDTATTLFIGGLLRDSMDEADIAVLLPGVKSVRRPPGKGFAFAEFYEHEAAKKVVDTAARMGFSVNGRTLMVGWGKGKETGGQRPAGGGGGGMGGSVGGSVGGGMGGGMDRQERERQLVPPSEDAKLLFVGGLGADEEASLQSMSPLLPGLVSFRKVVGKAFGFAEFEDYAAAMAVVTRSIGQPLLFRGLPLGIGWANQGERREPGNGTGTGTGTGTANIHGNGNGNGNSFGNDRVMEPPSSAARVLFLGNLPADATEEDILQLFAQGGLTSVKRPEGKPYAFLEFAGHAQAREAMRAGEGGEGEGEGLQLHGRTVGLGWAKGRAADKATQSADCWFCLASPQVKVHLIVSVGRFSYLALPRGGVSAQHVLIAPIECVPSRVHLTEGARGEMLQFQERIEQMYKKLGVASLRFERALRTKGSRDHMQASIIPLPGASRSKSFAVFLQKASAHQLKFHEVQDEQAIDEVVVSMEGGPYQEYFYIEIPTGEGDSAKHRRFVYVQEEADKKFPMQFGLEVAAEILGQPERGHWKHCLLKEDEEAKLCDLFREDFAPFDFTLSA
ncbi:CwfJ C-terminus 1-domain-containing protein-like protein [Ochromonadaceae sp. CCMP2298]|nr:CwfJ C-terminus 1-domain-containing protein-like protein [Ochromonadaceae sp. CCMP2298]